ncbi:MAG TPA: citrate:proton symporter [Gemmatimonadaceae bacterium]|nr:citrate:proton symporter [Gemmatimonadaceae bacterium]
MLALLGVTTIVVLLAAIMSGRVTPLVALIVVPMLASFAGGFGLETGKFVTAGVQSLAPVVAMFVFAILFFGIVTDAGMFDPIIGRIVRTVGSHPTSIVVGTFVLAALVHLDGSGAVTFLVTVPAMLPLYERLSMDRRVLAAVVALGAGVMNVLPWGGPTLRAAAALKIPVAQLYRPLVPAQVVGILFAALLAWWLGRRGTRRLAALPLVGARDVGAVQHDVALSDAERALRRPGRFWINVALTVAVLGLMIASVLPPAVMFMLGTAAALLVNYPSVAMQRARVDAHAKSAIMMASILLAAGVFTGIMQGSGMLGAMASAAASHVSPGAAPHVPFALALVSMPLSLLFDPDSFYFGVLPVVAETTRLLGVTPERVAHGALMGQMTLGFPVSPLTPSTFLLVGLTGVELGAHQRFTIPLLWATSIVMAVALVITGVISL